MSLTATQAFVDDAPARSSRRQARVVLADDDPDIRALVGGPLRKRGFEVIEKSDGNELLDYVAARTQEMSAGLSPADSSPLILVTDIRMPGCDGLSIVAGIRRWGWPIPVVFISAIEDEWLVSDMDRLGVAAFFHKPFDPKLLAFFIQEIAEGST